MRYYTRNNASLAPSTAPPRGVLVDIIGNYLCFYPVPGICFITIINTEVIELAETRTRIALGSTLHLMDNKQVYG